MIFARMKSLEILQLEREKPCVAGPNLLSYMVSKGIPHATPQDVIFRDHSSFVAGELSWLQSHVKFILSEDP